MAAGPANDLSEVAKMKELEYMAGTIPSSWEFVDVVFLITEVSRATAQQITRTRNAVYAMQSQRVTDVSQSYVVNPYSEGTSEWFNFQESSEACMAHYNKQLMNGATFQDARGLLPINITCNLVAKYNLRSFVDLMRTRASLRAQGEYSEIAAQMKELVLEAWPWSAPFFQHPLDKAIAMLEKAATEIGVTTGRGPAWEIAKAIDLLRKS